MARSKKDKGAGRKAASAILALAAMAILSGVPSDAGAASGGEFNPWLHRATPNMKAPTGAEAEMLAKIGAKPQSIEAEAGWRPRWRDEAYPVFFGRQGAPHEVLVLLDFAEPASLKVWRSVAEAMRGMDPGKVAVAVMADSKELYAYDMMGLAIWAQTAMGKGAATLGWALERWNDAKSRKRGTRFINEYDAASSPSELPMVFQGLRLLGVPDDRGSDVASYAYEAGNVNMHQCGHAKRFYGAKGMPAVIVDGRPLAQATPQAILAALR